MKRILLHVLSLLIILAGSAACGPADAVKEYFRDPTPHEAYTLNLARAGLNETALGRAWIGAAESALSNPLTIEAPYEEEGFFPPEEPLALGFLVSLRRGHRLEVRVDMAGVSDQEPQVFVDIFRRAPDTTRAPVPVLSGEAGVDLVFEPRRTGDYLIRVQPELLRGGRFQIRIGKDPAMAFPVAGRSSRSILSFFGDPREAGRRTHHGVDIFAPRGTPVVATAEAYVTRVDTTPRGGRVVWLRDNQRRASIYYAHLEEALTREGTRVGPGDTIGLVGNTGNARTTPPHLHFGLYFRGEGPLDPWDYIAELPSDPAPVDVDLAELGSWVRVSGNEINLRDRPTRRGSVLADLPRHTAVRVMGGVGSWYRVRLPDGGEGFVAGRLTESAEESIRIHRMADFGDLQAEPRRGSPVMDRVPEGSELPVLGTFGDYLFVQTPGGRAGWMAQEQRP